MKRFPGRRQSADNALPAKRILLEGHYVLVFTRKRDEAIVIGEGIEVRILRVGRDGVRLGVIAPPSIAVHRREIYDQIRDENQTAAAAAPGVRELARRLRLWTRADNPSSPGDTEKPS